MKFLLSALLLFSITLSVAQTEVLEKAQGLINEKKYNSAFVLLEDEDPENKNPEIAIAKSEILMEYFVTSLNHQLFALKDLEPDQDILEVRGSNGSFKMYSFRIDSVLLNLMEEFPEDYRLPQQIGEFYYEVYLRYSGRYVFSDEELVAKCRSYSLMAFNHGVYDWWTCYLIGYSYMFTSDFVKAIPYLEKSIELKNDYAPCHYNLAYSYMDSDRRDEGIQSAKMAYELYEEPELKADAARMVGVLYLELGQDTTSLQWYLVSDSISPDNYYSLGPIVKLQRKLQHNYLRDYTQTFFELDPSNPTVYQDLIKYYSPNDGLEELASFFEAQLESYTENEMVTGNLYFFIGVIYTNLGDRALALENFRRAKTVFANVLKSDHEVFSVIDSYMEAE